MSRQDIALTALSLHGRVLLQRRREPNGTLDGLWEFPGGKRRDGEDFAEAALRELHEETGVRGNSCGEIARVWHDYADRQVALRLFLLELDAGEPVEITDNRRFFSIEELPALAMPAANGPLLTAVIPRLIALRRAADPQSAHAAQVIREAAETAGIAPPDCMVIAGSGMTTLWAERAVAAEIPYEWLPGYPVKTIPGQHPAAQLLAGDEGRSVLLLRGRLHGYQGYDAWECARPVRLAAALGITRVLSLCAAGGLAPDRPAGSLVILRDHLNLTGDNIGRAPGGARAGEPLFIAQNDLYDEKTRIQLLAFLGGAGLPVAEGVLAALPGPLYETPAEVSMLRSLGADAVSMSLVHEAAASSLLNIRFAALALITNLAAGLSPAPPSHDEVHAAGSAIAARLDAPLLKFLSAWR